MSAVAVRFPAAVRASRSRLGERLFLKAMFAVCAGGFQLTALDLNGSSVALDWPVTIVKTRFPRFRSKLRDIIVFAGSKSNYLSKKVINHYFGQIAFTPATHVYLALATTLPDDTTTGTTVVETDYTSYARTEIGTGNDQSTSWNTATGTTTATCTNISAITCPTATGASTNPITGIMVTDASTVGNSYVWASVTSTAIANGDTPKVNAAALSDVED